MFNVIFTVNRLLFGEAYHSDHFHGNFDLSERPRSKYKKQQVLYAEETTYPQLSNWRKERKGNKDGIEHANITFHQKENENIIQYMRGKWWSVKDGSFIGGMVGT